MHTEIHMRLTRTILMLACAVLATGLAACEKAPRELRMVTPAGPIDREIVEDLSELFNNERVLTRIRLVEPAMSGSAALDAIAADEADIALVSNDFDFRRDVATVMPLYSTVLHIARPSDVDTPVTLESLRNAAVYAGPSGSASRLMFESFVAELGLGDDEYRYVSDPGEGADVIIVFAPISPERMADYPGYVLSSVGTPDEIGIGGQIDAAVLLNPHYQPFVIPIGTYGDLTPEPVVTIAVDKILVVRADLDSSVVYDLINDVLRLRPALAGQRPGLFRELSDDFDVSRSRFIVHAGTQAYLQRSEPTIYERYSGIAEVVVTIMIGLISASIAGVRIYNMRRKNRIDRFYAATIDIRDSVNDSMDAEQREQAIARVRELQNEAFDQLVHEKLAANESFRIFITLSNDVLRQLGAIGLDHQSSDA